MSNGLKRSLPIWLIAALIAIRVVSIVVLLNSDLESPDSILGGDAKRYQEIASGKGTPYQDFDVEYPPGTLALIKVIAAPTLHETHLRLAISQLALELGTAGALAWGFSRRTAIAFLILGTPAIFFPFPYMRTDLLTVFLATVAVSALHRGLDTSSGASLAAATFAKIWPLVIAPILIVERRIRGLWAWAITGLVGLIAWVTWAGTDGISQTVTFRGAKGWQIESILGAMIKLWNPSDSHFEQGAWRSGVAVNAPVRIGLSILTLVSIIAIWWMALRRRSSGGQEHLSFGIAPLACIAALLIFSTIISTQYILWLIPFAAIAAAAGERKIGWLTLAIVASTTVVLATLRGQIRGQAYAMAPLLFRNGLIIVLLIEAITALRSRACTAESPATTNPYV